ncbi:hypothetical protein J5S49_13375 [Virgibacillus halodenitrificans]|uniref:hypothetical protein n=1 Tax=Virgibacillus halodenitrificans TaxID=1482 RepID=UPI001F40A8CA|nr:hypothetical protein [Virgibacillus halodenitrificans]MCG1029282.1 hypothetical protein [Virgibacillus halodenitrificans]
MEMSPRKAVEIATRTWLDVMVDQKDMNIPENRRDSLAIELADSFYFLEHMENAVESYLEDFGDNHELYDLFD